MKTVTTLAILVLASASAAYQVNPVEGGSAANGEVASFDATRYITLDLALPKPPNGQEVWPETAKPGWTIWADPKWADMSGHDMACLYDIAGSQIDACLTVGDEGEGGLYVKGMCERGMEPPEPLPAPEGDPIANSWYHAVDAWGDPVARNILLLLSDLPAGQYELYSYHNGWEPCPDTPKCFECVCGMPPMPSITANPLPPEPLRGYHEWVLPPGTGAGVIAIENAYNVPVTHVYSDYEVSQSLIKFETDGSEVLVIYEAPQGHPDCARPGREGGRSVLNAFQLVLVKRTCECLGDIADTPGYGSPDGKVDIGDMAKLLAELILHGGPVIPCQIWPPPELLECADITGSAGFGPPDGRIDTGDMAMLLAHLLLKGDPDKNYESPCIELP